VRNFTLLFFNLTYACPRETWTARVQCTFSSAQVADSLHFCSIAALDAKGTLCKILFIHRVLSIPVSDWAWVIVLSLALLGLLANTLPKLFVRN